MLIGPQFGLLKTDQLPLPEGCIKAPRPSEAVRLRASTFDERPERYWMRQCDDDTAWLSFVLGQRASCAYSRCVLSRKKENPAG
jgi:hypothetical protein